MKKKVLYVILSILLLGVLTGCNNTKFKKEYEDLNGKENKNGKVHRTITIDEDNPFVYSSAENIVKMIEAKKTFYVYFGDPLCPWCRSVLEKFIEVAKKNNVDKVYYVKIWDDEGNEVLRTKYQVIDDNVVEHIFEGTESYHKLLEYFDNVLTDYTLTDKDGKTVGVGEKRIYAPNFIYVENGQAVKLVEGISSLQTDSRQELSEEMLTEEETIFNEFFEK